MKKWALVWMLVASIAGCAVDASAPPPVSAEEDDVDVDVAQPGAPDAPNAATSAPPGRFSSPSSIEPSCIGCGPGPQPWHGIEGQPSTPP
jgi:hypothetical protein